MEVHKIKEIRKSKKLTQKQLGEKCGIAESTIRQYELGLRNPKFETLCKIAKALEVPVDELIKSISIGFMTDDDIKAVEYYQQQSDVSSEKNTDTISADTSKLLKAIEKSPKMQQATENFLVNSHEIINNYFEMLNDTGQTKAIEQIELLTKIPEYRKK